MIQLTNEQLNNLNKKALIILVSSLQDQLASVQAQLDTANAQLADNNRQIELLTEQIRLMNQRHFGRHTEAASEIEDQLSFFDSFNEAEATSDPAAPEPEITEIVISSYKRSKTKGKREADLDGLPARIIEHKLSDEELAEKFPEGYKELPEEIYKRLHIIPETFIVDEHHVHVYASKKNTGKIVKAPRSVDLFRNSISTPALVASIINGKYVNALPLDRQARSYKMNGIHLEANTMANWVIGSAEQYLSLIYDRMHEHIYDSQVIHADETPVKVMQIAGCWIHTRRKYADFIKSVGVEKAKGTLAAEGYSMITDILHTDNGYDDLSKTDRKKMRQRELSERVDAYFEWAKLKYNLVTRGSVIGKALAYSINQEEYLRTFLKNGKVPPDNNYAEQAIRPFTIARKNFVLMESSKGASASAMIFSIAETAKTNQLNTYEYFELLLTEIPKHQDDKDLRFLNDLLPCSKNVQEKYPSRFKKS